MHISKACIDLPASEARKEFKDAFGCLDSNEFEYLYQNDGSRKFGKAPDSTCDVLQLLIIMVR